jgi:N-acetylneuraminic acid mutarotase
LLSDGRVLVVGGRGCFFPICGSFPSAELYDPATNAWTFTGTLADARAGHTATLLQNGMVIVAGGGNGSHFFATSELYDPATSVWTAAGSLASVRSGHTATILPNGRVLIAAGSSPPIGKSNLIPSATAELYDPASNTWKVAGSLTTARIAHAMTLMSNGQVLVVGGYNGDQILASAEVYEPATDVWTATGALAVARVAHTATLLLNGKVLVAGGDNYGGIGAVTYSSAELYNLAINP